MSVEIFRTVVQVDPSKRKLSYKTPLFLIGSCFTENIGEKLEWYKFPVVINPFGIVYNPLSVFQSIQFIIGNKKYTATDISNYNGQYFSFDHHSRFSDSDLNVCLTKINTSIHAAHEKLLRSSFLFITLGSAFFYRLKSNQRIVANCHKLPEKEFDRNIMSVDEVVNAYELLNEVLLKFNPGIQVVFTVSPIRHWKDGAHENNLSKSVVLLAINEIAKKFENVTYFPAYELMLDELRDYRFYDEDMLHPNKIAIDFIWKRFLSCFSETDNSKIMNEIEKIQLARQHRPFNTKTEAFQTFIVQQINRINMLSQQFPEIDLSSEYKYFKLLM
jgi:hypothetical protein